MMNLSQTKLVGLTMELDLKAREYKTLCDKFDKLKEKKIDPNDERLLVVKDLFQKNASLCVIKEFYDVPVFHQSVTERK